MTQENLDKPTIALLLVKLQAALRRAPAALIALVHGEVELVLVGHEPRDFTIHFAATSVTIEPHKASQALVRIGMTQGIFRHLMAGDLDVERAFRDRRLAIEGDRRIFARFVACFEGGQSALQVLTSR